MGLIGIAPARTRLPERRLAAIVDLAWGGRVWALDTGFDRDGRVREIFLSDGARPGSEIDALVADACVACSLLLQRGVDAAELARRLGRESVEPGAAAASILGAAARLAAEIEGAEGPGMVAAYAAAVGAGLPSFARRSGLREGGKPAPTQAGPA